MSSSGRSGWNLSEQIVIRVQQQDVDDTTTRNSDRGKDWSPNTLGARETEGDSQQLTRTSENNTGGLGEQMHNSNEVTQRCQQRKTQFTYLKILKYGDMNCPRQ